MARRRRIRPHKNALRRRGALDRPSTTLITENSLAGTASISDESCLEAGVAQSGEHRILLLVYWNDKVSRDRKSSPLSALRTAAEGAGRLDLGLTAPVISRDDDIASLRTSCLRPHNRCD